VIGFLNHRFGKLPNGMHGQVNGKKILVFTLYHERDTQTQTIIPPQQFKEGLTTSRGPYRQV
jgi:hypothetical protein